MLSRDSRFLKNFVCATWHCVSQELGALPIAIVSAILWARSGLLATWFLRATTQMYHLSCRLCP